MTIKVNEETNTVTLGPHFIEYIPVIIILIIIWIDPFGWDILNKELSGGSRLILIISIIILKLLIIALITVSMYSDKKEKTEDSKN